VNVSAKLKFYSLWGVLTFVFGWASGEVPIPSAVVGDGVETLWFDGYSSSRADEASHFILEGEGERSARIFAVAEVVDSVASAEAMRSIVLEISRFEGNDWELVETVSLDVAGEFGLGIGARVGEAQLELSSGSYLIQFRFPESLSALTSTQLDFEVGRREVVPRLANASILGFMGGPRLKREIGFSVLDGFEREMLVRNVGPTLENFGLEAVVSDPHLMMLRDGLKIAGNDDWWSGISISSDQMSADMQLMGAFGLNEQSSDSAVRISVAEGDYQVISRARSSKGGYEMVEVYFD